jgi:NNP family nitrate/nitrite transporter-like MFS transporter
MPTVSASAMSAPLAYWDPDDRTFWVREGSRVARRNLAISAAALLLSFAVWMMWSVVVVELPRAGFRFTTNQLFWLAAVPGLAGGTLRLIFAFLVPIFGGRTWTTFSTLLLLVPTVGLGFAVQDPTTSYPTFVALALAAGVGGGNFASSMSNISFFFPTERKGTALGLNAGVGNLGVSLAQLVVPAAVAFALLGTAGGPPQGDANGASSHAVWLQNAGFLWVPAILVVAALAWTRMDDLAVVRASLGDQASVVLRRDTWVLAWLYLGTFGSFIGFAAGFPLMAETQFTALDATAFAFAGPLLASVARPVGGYLSDRFGGASVSLACFVAMAVAVLLLLALRPQLHGFLTLYAILFAASGAGNGAVFQLIPAVFAARHRQQGSADGEDTGRAAALEAAAALGLASGIAAFGGFFIPKAYGSAVAWTGQSSAALALFLLFYLSCIAVTWWFYARPAVPPLPLAAR